MSNNINNGLMTKIWGPHMWIALQSVAFGYPVNPTSDQKEQYKIFFKYLGFVLPCIYCRQSYQFFITDGQTKLDDNIFESRDTLTKWVYNIHNRVNHKLGVNYGTTYEEMCELYESIRAKCQDGLPGCQMPLELKAIAFKKIENKQFNIIPKKVALYFKDYAKSRNIDFDKLDYYEDLLLNKRDANEFEKRNRDCSEIIKEMRYNAIPSLEKSGKYQGLPTINELKLISMLCTNLPIIELEDCVKNLGITIKRKYKLVK